MTSQVKQLAEEIIAHIRDVAGADALVSAFTVAKKEVSAVRSERKRRAAVQVRSHCYLLHAHVLLCSAYIECVAFCWWSFVACLEHTVLGYCHVQRLHYSYIFVCVASLQVLVDPEAAARSKLHKQERRAAGRKRKMEEMQRRRGAGVAVKNKKKHKSVET